MIFNLRRGSSFVLLAVFLGTLSLLVVVAWPEAQQINLAQGGAGRSLVNVFFLAQYLVVALMTPSFAAGAITLEKERGSYEMLLASPLKPTAIVWGKLLASLGHVGLMVVLIAGIIGFAALLPIPPE